LFFFVLVQSRTPEGSISISERNREGRLLQPKYFALQEFGWVPAMAAPPWIVKDAELDLKHW
jgi:hypothetical protein